MSKLTLEEIRQKLGGKPVETREEMIDYISERVEHYLLASSPIGCGAEQIVKQMLIPWFNEGLFRECMDDRDTLDGVISAFCTLMHIHYDPHGVNDE